MADEPATAVACSEHPVPAHAVAECAGALLEASPAGFTGLLCVVGPPFGGALSDITSALSELLGAAGAAGIESRGVLMGARVAWDAPSLAVIAFRRNLWARHTSEVFPHGGSGPSHDVGVGFTTHEGGFTTQEVGAGSATDGTGRRFIRLTLADGRSASPATARVTGGPTAPGPTASVEEWQSLGGCVEGDGTGALRTFCNGAEHRGGALVLETTTASSVLELIQGTTAISHGVTVTDMDGDEIVALDGLPAREYLESLLAAADPALIEQMAALGFAAVDGRLVAVRRSGAGLATSMRVDPGDVLVPSVASTRAALSQMAAACAGCGGDAAFVLVDPALSPGLGTTRWSEQVGGGRTPLVGLVVSAVLRGGSDSWELLSPAALVIGLG